MVLSTFDQENHDRILKEDILDRINQLNQKLLENNRTDDLLKSTTDKKFQEQLLAEYHLSDN